MSRSVRRVSAIALTVALLGAGLAISSPAGAAPSPARVLPPGVSLSNAGTLAAPEYTLQVDCSEIRDSGTYDYDTQFDFAEVAIPLGDVVTVLTSNCTNAYLDVVNFDEPRATPAYTPIGGANDGVIQESGSEWSNATYVSLDTTEFTVGPNTRFTTLETSDFADGYFNLYVALAVAVADPPGEFVEDVTMDIPGNASADMVVADDPQYYDGDGDLALGGIEGCGISPGDHFYAETSVIIEKAGIYSFRVSNIDPTSLDVDFQQPERYLQDPFLALYSTFTPADGHLGVVGCNDDSDLDEFSDYNITSDGTMISDRFPQFSVELQPGTYTLVLTSFDAEQDFTIVAAPVSANVDSPEDPKGGFSSTAFGEDESATVGVWYADSQLAATGPNPVSGGMLAAGLALMTLGGLAFATRRRWSRA